VGRAAHPGFDDLTKLGAGDIYTLLFDCAIALTGTALAFEGPADEEVRDG
jgi:hypothetical protein